jgi:cysteine desulfurase
MEPYLYANPANPHGAGAQHKLALAAVDLARRQIADLIHARPDEIVFTSGATESNNLAIQGIVKAYAHKGRHIITCVTEHKSVLEVMRYLEQRGFTVTCLPVQANGILDIRRLEKAIRPDTILVSIMAVNNEIGVIQSTEKIGQICRRRRVLFHCDGAQAVGKIPVDVRYIDALSISGHKMYAPKGIGALYVRKGVKIAPIMFGGGQQDGIKPGTLPVPLCVALGSACDICKKSLKQENSHIARLQQYLLRRLKKLFAKVVVNGDLKKRIPGNLSIQLDKIDTEEIVRLMPNFAISVASSCYGQGQTSHVLQALPNVASRNTLRIGLGRFTTEKDIDLFTEALAQAVQRMKHAKTPAQKNYELLSKAASSI